MNDTVRNTLMGVPKHPHSPYIFCNDIGKPYANVRTSFDTALKRAEITNFRFHDLRHTFASHLVMLGIDLKSVQELLGHKSFEMTLRYSHLSPSHKSRAVDVLDRNLVGKDTNRTPQAEKDKLWKELSSLTAEK